ncbi:MAG TPA: hypothetical protein VFH70_10280 [Acidimicrobiales bacterium]|nr:hypothetical protein [Acidimicrobiales bacterium]
MIHLVGQRNSTGPDHARPEWEHQLPTGQVTFAASVRTAGELMAMAQAAPGEREDILPEAV